MFAGPLRYPASDGCGRPAKEKLLFTFAAAWTAFGFVDANPVSWILPLAAAVTVLNYLVGDVLTRRDAGNTVAPVADGGLAVKTEKV
jgi:hypothetical protein